MQVSVAPPAVVRARVTELVSPVDGVAVRVLQRSPRAAAPSGTPLVLPPGWVVNASLVAAAAVIVKVVLVAEVSDPSVAVSV